MQFANKPRNKGSSLHSKQRSIQLGITLWIVAFALCEFPFNVVSEDPQFNNATTTNNTSSEEHDHNDIDMSHNETLSSSANETDYEWEDGNWRRKDGSKVAAIAVYCSVILIALFGVLIRYFVTQYETLQAKAQLEYQQLRNVRIQ